MEYFDFPQIIRDGSIIFVHNFRDNEFPFSTELLISRPIPWIIMIKQNHKRNLSCPWIMIYLSSKTKKKRKTCSHCCRFKPKGRKFQFDHAAYPIDYLVGGSNSGRFDHTTYLHQNYDKIWRIQNTHTEIMTNCEITIKPKKSWIRPDEITLNQNHDDHHKLTKLAMPV